MARRLAFACLFVLIERSAFSQTAKSGAETPPRERAEINPVDKPSTLGSTGALSSMLLKPVAPGVFELGLVTLNKPQRTVSFPATLNMDQGPVEYFLVAGFGKTHESVFRTEAAPYDIHLAMLLLGVSAGRSNVLPARPHAGSVTNAEGVGQSGPLANSSKEILPGEKIGLEVSWKSDPKEIRRRAEEFIFNTQTKSVLTNSAWIYNGSRIADGQFFAQLSGSIVSLVTDPDALVNYAGPGHDDDKIWSVNTNSVPPLRTPVRVSITLREPLR